MLPAYRRIPLLLLVLGLPVCTTIAQDIVRVATYNIRTLDTDVVDEGDRLDKLRQVIDLLDADVIGLQEIADRDALRLLFPVDTWSLLIDDDSQEFFDIDLAIAVRRPYRILGFGEDPNIVDFDADDEHFLFPDLGHEDFFRGRRDVLVAEIQPPGDADPFFMMTLHAKSRRDGRDFTDPVRLGAARALVQKLRDDFDDRPFVLLGDFNDNPDDRSLNILETGNPDAPGGPEETLGPFLANLTEALVVDGHVSYGRKSNDVIGDRLGTIDPDSRRRNNDARGTNANTGDILFDQILIPAWMIDQYVAGSAQAFDFAVGAVGNETNRASDHLPVFAELALSFPEPEDPVDPVVSAMARLTALLPNPDGDDAGREEVTITNFTDTDLDLSTWRVRDEAGNEFQLSGVVPPSARLTFVMTTNRMPLNNSGDVVTLLDANGDEVHSVRYTSSEAGSGTTVFFPFE